MSALCSEILTPADVRARYGGDVDSLSDATLRQMLDRLVSEMEGVLGHGFGRAAWVSASDSSALVVSSTALTVGGDAYAFADYATLGALVAAVNGAGDAYQIDLAPHVRYDTPCTLLRAVTSTPVGPTYDLRQPLCLSGLYWKGTGGQSHMFLPLPVASVASVSESGTALASTSYWVQLGKSWLIRKACPCTATDCNHQRGHWLATYPDNVVVTYAPMWWGRAPAAVGAALLEAFGAAAGVGGMESENFLGYSYRRATPAALRAGEILGGASLRGYQVAVG